MILSLLGLARASRIIKGRSKIFDKTYEIVILMTFCEFEQFGCTFGAFRFYSKMATVSQMDENMELAFAFAAPSQMFLSLLLSWCQHSLGAPLRSVPIDPPMSVSHPQWTHIDKWFPKIQPHRALVILKPDVSNQHVGRVMALLSLKSAQTQIDTVGEERRLSHPRHG